MLPATSKAHPDLPSAPIAINMSKSEESRWLNQSGIHDQSAILRPSALPPGMPKDRVKILRTALQHTMKDPEFLSEAKTGNLAIDPISGDEIKKMIGGLVKMEPGQVAKLREILLLAK